MKKYYKKNLGAAISLALSEISMAIVSILLVYIIQVISETASNNSREELHHSIMIMALFILYSTVVVIWLSFSKSLFYKNIMRDIKDDLFYNIINKRYREFNQENTSTYVSMINNDLKLLEEGSIHPIFVLMQNITELVIAFIYAWVIDKGIALLMLILSVLSLVLPKLYSRGISEANDQYMKKLARYNGILKDSFVGFEAIINFGILKNIEEKHKKENRDLEKEKYHVRLKTEIANSATTMTRVCTQIILLLGCTFLVIEGRIPVYMLLALINLSGSIIGPLYEIISGMITIRSSKSVKEKIVKILEDIPEENKNTAIEMKQDISLEHIGFSYGEKSILKDISITFQSGKKYAVVGESGSGKSTILRLLLRYYDEYDGEIKIDGKNYKTLDEKEINNLCSIVSQNVFLFEDTLWNNITMYQQYSKEEVIQAMEQAGLKEFLEHLEQGLDTLVKENGNNFSGGEKQRISIARALLRNKNILLADEITASLDALTSKKIENILLQQENIMMIAIIHHFSVDNMNKYDSIIAMKDGKIIETGTYKELMEKQGYFYRLAVKQGQ